MPVSSRSGDHTLESARQSLREMDERFQLLVDSVKDYAIFILDQEGVVTTWNSGAERIKGYRADEIIGQHFSRFYPESDVRAGKCELELETAIAEGRFEDEGWRLRKDGTRFWANVIITSFRDARGELVGFAKITRDLTERRAAEDARVQLARTTAEREEAERALAQLTRLQDLGGALAAAMTPEELAKIVVEKGSQALGAVAASFARWTGKDLALTAAVGVSPGVAETYRSFAPTLPVPTARAFSTKHPQWIETSEDFAREYPDMPDAGAHGAACALPLAVGERIGGVVYFRFSDARSFTLVERAFMETFASHVALALERTEGHARELAGRRRLEALSTLAEALSTALTTTDVANVVVETGRKAAAADTCTLYVLDERTRSLDLLAERGCNPLLLERIRKIGPESDNPTYTTITTGKAVWVQNAEEYASFFPALANAPIEGQRAVAFWSLPLVAEGQTIGLLAMGSYEPRQFPPGEREFVETFTRHCSEALLRARRLDAERDARRVAESLQASLATTLRSIGDAVLATDATGRVKIMNPVAEYLTGWSEDEARGRPLHEIFRIVDEHTGVPISSPVDKVLELGTVTGLANQTVLVHRNGQRKIPVDDSAAPIRGRTGTVDGVVLVFRDVTTRKREQTRRNLLEEATKALTESLDYEDTLAKVTALAVPGLADYCSVDMLEEGQRVTRQLAVAHVDPAKIDFARELGRNYPIDLNAPTGIPNVLRTGKSELYPEITADLLRAGAVDDEYFRITQDLEIRSAMLVPLITRGRAVGVLTFVWAESGGSYTHEDLAFAEELARRCAVAFENARLYAAEQDARKSGELANRAKDEFLAMVSHELRTPLNAIMGWAKMLTSYALDEPKRARAIETIDRNAVAMAQLIEDLLDISRIISGKMRLDVQQVDLARVVEAAIESVRPAADAKEIRIVTTLDTTVGFMMGDPTRLQQIVWNLLSNAVKFASKGGAISVVVRREVSTLEICVSDDGKGIAPRFLPHVFDPFRQEDASHTRSRGGLGLGLAITRQLVELHGGRVEARSEGEGRGATFTVQLPIASVSRATETLRSEPRRIRIDSSFERPSQLRGVKVLVVDDEEDARLLVKAVLEECGCQVAIAADVPDAMTKLSEESPDLLISDIGMPQHDGYDLIRQVRALPAARGGSVPAAALTAYARAEDRRRVLNAGYSMHIPKPIEPSELVAVVVSLTRFLHRPLEAEP